MYRPEWVAELARKYFTRTISQFILHGNIVDFVRAEDAAGATQYYRFKDYLLHELFKRRNIVVSFDRAAGISFRDPEVKRDFMTIFLPNYDLIHGTSFARGPLSDPQVAFALLESYFMNRLRDGKKIAFIIDYAETLAPMGASSYASVQDRAILVFLQRWAKESLFLNSDMTTVLLAENLNDLNQQLVRNPYTCEIDVPYPEVNERLDFVRYFFRQNPRVAEKLEMDEAVFADNTSGLNLVQLKTMLAEIDAGEQTFTHEELSRRKKAIIELEAGGLLEFIESKYNLDSVAGHAAAKSHLRAAAGALRKGKGDVLPMGYLVNGPVGTGKTFLVSCFASDIGIPMLQLKNFRSQWQGVTEANLEKVLKIISAMAPVAVMIDEADAYLGSRNQQGDSGVSNRVFSMIVSFMSNTDHRGRIIWFLLTARPDLMPVDLKRQGRAEEHIALFYPETVAEKRELFEVMLRKTKIKEIKAEELGDDFFDGLTILSGADMEAALTRAKFKAAAQGLDTMTPDIIRQTFDDFLPPTYPEEIELMNYVAVLECTSKELLPQRFREMPREELLRRINALKGRMGL